MRSVIEESSSRWYTNDKSQPTMLLDFYRPRIIVRSFLSVGRFLVERCKKCDARQLLLLIRI